MTVTEYIFDEDRYCPSCGANIEESYEERDYYGVFVLVCVNCGMCHDEGDYLSLEQYREENCLDDEDE